MSILSALKQQNSSIDSLAALPQAMIMQMAQRKEISEAMVAPILARKAELADAFARQNVMANAGKAQPTVMEQLLTKNAQLEQPTAPEETGVAQLPIPERNYAGGGIVAFANGGMYDDDEEDTEDARFTALMDAIPAGIRSIPAALSNLANKLPKSYEATKAAMSVAAPKVGGHKYEEAVIAEAKKQGVDPNLALHVLYKETGGHKTPESARSHAGAIGPMQLMPKTAKSLGVDPSDPMQNIHGGVKYLAQLGKMFDYDPRLTAAAYNAGPGNVRKHGGVPNFHETQNYVRGLAAGGEVQHYANQGYVDPMGIYGGDYEERDTAFDPFQEALASYKKQAIERAKTNKALQGTNLQIPSNQRRPAVSAPPVEQVQDKNLTVIPISQAQAQPQPAPKSGLESFMEQLNQQKTDIAKQRQEDKNMALLTAGLGMLGGTSQYAFENIGKGALAGVQNLSEANKQRAAEMNALNKSMLYGHHYQGVEEAARANAANTYGMRQAEHLERQRANNLSAIKSMKDDARAIAIAGLKQQGMIGMDMEDPNTAMKIEQATRSILANEPAYGSLYKSTFGTDYNSGMQNSFAGFSAKERKK